MMRCDLETTRVEVVGWARKARYFCIGRRELNLFCASGWELCSTEVELSVLIESSYSVDLALEFGKAWNRVSSVVIFVIHSFLLETVVSVCCEEESSTKPIGAFAKPTV